MQQLFHQPDFISQNVQESDLISFLASKVTESHEKADPLGVSRIVDFVSMLQKPVITHNGMLDLMFLHDKFYEPLPQKIC